MVTNTKTPLSPRELVEDMLTALHRAGRDNTVLYFEGEAKKTFDAYLCIDKQIAQDDAERIMNALERS